MTSTKLERDGFGNTAQVLTLGTHQSVAYTGTAGTISAEIGTNVVRVIATTDCYIKIGASPTATSSDVFLLANAAEYFGCDPADKVSAIQVSSGGTIHVTAGA